MSNCCEIKLYNTAKSRERIEALADVFSLIVATENLEKAFVRDAVASAEYTPACQKLIGQFRTSLALIDRGLDISRFLDELNVSPLSIDFIVFIEGTSFLWCFPSGQVSSGTQASRAHRRTRHHRTRLGLFRHTNIQICG